MSGGRWKVALGSAFVACILPRSVEASDRITFGWSPFDFGGLSLAIQWFY